MHLYPVVVILAVLAFGGIAAYLGDVIGYRLGRKRLTLFGLRPRTTATLVGIVAGVLIPAVTVAVGAWQIKDVRVALFQLDDIRHQVQNLTQERDTLGHERNVLAAGKRAAQQEARKAEADASAAESQLSRVEGYLQSAERNLAAAEAGLKRLETTSQRLTGELQKVRAELKRATSDLARAHTVLVGLQGQKTELQGKVKELQNRTDELSHRAETLTTELQDKIAQGQALHDLFATSRPIFELGTEVVRGVVERPRDIESLKNALAELLAIADLTAESGGAAKGSNNRFVRAVGPTPLDAEPGKDGFVPEERLLGVVVNQLWQAAEASHVVRVIVVRRTFVNQQVYVVFYAQPNRLVFRKGEPIVQREIPPRQDQATAFEQLWRLIADPKRSEVRKQAQAAGLLPDPNTERFGEISIRELYDAAGKCADQDRPMAVRVQAAADTYTVGPLSIDIAVEASSGG